MAMQMPKPTEADKERFRDLVEPLLAESGAVEVKPMFGNLGAFANGNMFAGLFGSEVGVKLDPSDAAELESLGGGPWGPAERPMGGYLSVPTEVDAADWVARAASYVSTLPPKVKKAPKKK
jgi:TfoX/Sxy family transcriptional regulator of competence genes